MKEQVSPSPLMGEVWVRMMPTYAPHSFGKLRGFNPLPIVGMETNQAD